MASLALHALLAVCLIADRYVLGHHQRNMATRVLLFPCLWTGVWFLCGRFSAIGDYPSLSTALVNWPDFAQVASLGGRSVMDFLVALFGTCIVELSSFPAGVLSPVKLPTHTTEPMQGEEETNEEDTPLEKSQYIALLTHPVTVFSIIMALVLTYGGARTNIRKNAFYQVNYPQYVPKNELVGCVVGPGTDFPDLQMDHDIWFNKSTMLAEVCKNILQPHKLCQF